MPEEAVTYRCSIKAVRSNLSNDSPPHPPQTDRRKSVFGGIIHQSLSPSHVYTAFAWVHIINVNNVQSSNLTWQNRKVQSTTRCIYKQPLLLCDQTRLFA